VALKGFARGAYAGHSGRGTASALSLALPLALRLHVVHLICIPGHVGPEALDEVALAAVPYPGPCQLVGESLVLTTERFDLLTERHAGPAPLPLGLARHIRSPRLAVALPTCGNLLAAPLADLVLLDVETAATQQEPLVPVLVLGTAMTHRATSNSTHLTVVLSAVFPRLILANASKYAVGFA